MKKLEEIEFDNLTLRTLPVDDSYNPNTRQVPGACFSLVAPGKVDNPQLVAASPEALSLLDIDPSEVQIKRPDFVKFFSGNRPLPGSQYAAHCYAGHQFGYFSGQLGDGAAMYIGEVVNSAGERWELQFKGAGPTPYSRAADGRKVLRSSVREFLCSEAMYHLGVPTTRAGTCVTSDTRIVRDPLYDGNAIRERATVITRIAPTFLRFGSFEIFKPTDSQTGRTGPSVGREAEMLPAMLHHTIRTYYPHLWAEHGGDALAASHRAGNEDAWHPLYRAWFGEVVRRTASLVAAWQAVGWCHGVLNTDNMSIIGVTIDYGPFGFLDAYDPNHVCNGSDDGGRYTYKAQPDICRWNCAKLAEAVKWALPERIAKAELAVYDEEYRRTYTRLMRAKLGLTKQEEGDEGLVADLFQLMDEAGADFTSTFRTLARFPMDPAADPSAARDTEDALVSYCTEPEVLAAQRGSRIPPQNLTMLLQLAQRDPALLAQLGATPGMIQEEAERHKASEKLRAMSAQDKARADRTAWAQWLTRYGERLGREVAAGADPAARVATMNATNPRFVLRNWMAHEAIQAAEGGDFSQVQDLLELLRTPFTTENEDASFRAAVARGRRASEPSAVAAPASAEEAAAAAA
eukprot:CAMPEP_0202866778 /NCGR_PEP_ID=MMETSP1391-20130828/8355_1 /ASSEMBLY_ACC=CAM_ASM_000867 /TAXON_ID=1034604 /ORGANISM="Chlamydomonas leiostraca, Strain SAG 11-49" /LENGTH=630 /DNA_ID=CAMNT_0049546761 /DNA_START=152 /DNA_END=2041 /DNA_ORIENTATION=+